MGSQGAIGRTAFLESLLAPTPLCGRGSEIVERASDLGVDPLETAAHIYPQDAELVYRLAAERLGLGFATDIAPFIRALAPDADLDRLGQIGSIRGRLGGRTVLFIAPRLDQLMTLSRHIGSRPDLEETLHIVSPRTLRQGLVGAHSPRLLTGAIQRLARSSTLSAHLDLPLWLRAGFVCLALLIIATSVISIPVVRPVILGVAMLALLVPSVFRLWAAFTYSSRSSLQAARHLDDRDLPVYSILIPLRDEAHMVPQIVRAMCRLDYPPEKLDVMFVVESASSETVLAVEREIADPRFSLVVVPKAPPHTKPKALNYALPLARGEHVVVFDAEDVPDPSQLRRAASLFAQMPSLECLQAELLIANGSHHWIAHMFAAEYAGHFGVLLPAIGRARSPMPLGGTSNHFRTATLRRIGAWDAFNVTEDADLGIRMARLGLRVDTLAVATWEEAPESVIAWIRQRSRWMKGWMQTLLVHSRHPRQLLADLGWRDLFAFYIFVGGMVLAIAMHGLFLMSSFSQAIADIVATGRPGTWTMASFLTLALGYGGAAAINVIGLERLGHGGKISSILGLPVYWLIASYALVLAIFELLARPYHWAKTTHKGLPKGRPPHKALEFLYAPSAGKSPAPAPSEISR